MKMILMMAQFDPLAEQLILVTHRSDADVNVFLPYQVFNKQ